MRNGGFRVDHHLLRSGAGDLNPQVASPRYPDPQAVFSGGEDPHRPRPPSWRRHVLNSRISVGRSLQPAPNSAIRADWRRSKRDSAVRYVSRKGSHLLTHLYSFILCNFHGRKSSVFSGSCRRQFFDPVCHARLCTTFVRSLRVLSLSPFFGRSDSHRFSNVAGAIASQFRG